MRKQTNSEFIEKAKLIHGEKYEYSLVEYINSSIKVKIICPTHGVFEQIPNNHLSKKQGCGKCDGKHKTTEDFINEVKTVHGNRYNYSLVNYINNKTKIKIICPEHGVFEQEANAHLMGRNCFKCMDTSKTTEEFVNETKLVHGEKYCYSLVNYINNKTKVKIICSIHGEFEQEPSSHLKGSGCPKCFGMGKTSEEYINECILVHGNKYDYSLVEYNGVFKKVKIICKKHGVFEQMSDKHMKGCGCPICRESKGEKEIRKILTENKINFIGQKKFSDCKDKKVLPFDFYLPDYNMCIEYDGRQHFIAINRWGGEAGLIDQQNKDLIKTKYCYKNNIKLIRISYNDDISLELNKKLSIFGIILNKNK
jgi:hypothetical protein